MRADVMRTDLQRLRHERPFQPFTIARENGDRVVVDHPENIAFDPADHESIELNALASRIRLVSPFETVPGVARAVATASR